MLLSRPSVTGIRPRAVSRNPAGVTPLAIFGRKAVVVEEEPPKSKGKSKEKAAPAPEKRKGPSFLSQTISALDFAEVRSKKDADLLYEAKYGKRGADGKMTQEQYGALRRKIIGTSKDFWKDWVEEEQVKMPTYYKPADGAGGTVPYLPFLIAVVLALLGTTVLVVQKTGGAGM